MSFFDLSTSDQRLLYDHLTSKKWRLNNLYRIIDKNGNSIPFKLNPIQEKVLHCDHKRKLILKARQLGMSTFSVIDLLDDTIFTPNLATGIVSYSLEHAQHIFKRIIGHALDNFPKNYRAALNITGRSAREISFGNGSFLRVDTTLRGGTYQNILVSEFGKTCARSPVKAEEVVTGTLNTLPIDGKCIIESTGEGMDGYFAEYCLDAKQRGNKNLSTLDYQLLFFPWYDEAGYRIKDTVTYDVDLTDYFNKIEKDAGVKIDQQQRNWYALQKKSLGDKIKQEFPSTVQEAFLSRSDAYYFAELIERAYSENRMLHTSVYDPIEPVYVAMDIGVNDLTVIIFFQIIHGEIRIFDMCEDNNKGVDHYAKFLLQDKPYCYHTIFLPHDSVKRDPLDVVNSYEREFRHLFTGTNTNFRVLPRSDKQELINYAKLKLNHCVFNVGSTKSLISQLSKYRKRWHEPTGQYLDEPQPKQLAGHYADAFQYMAQAVGFVERGSVTKKDALEKHRKMTEARRKMI